MRAICLMGPTASGKTDLAIALSAEFPVENISVDSAQIYRGMNIGAAKPPPDILARFPHHLIDIRDPQQGYSAGEFCRDVVPLMRGASERGHIPLLVGGTMLYFQALQRGLAELPEADEGLREQLDARAAAEGWPALHADLQRLDPVTAARLQPTDAQRIQRALEVCLLTGEPMAEQLEATSPPVQARYLNVGLLPGDRKVLHERIAARLDRMLADGFVEEVRQLLSLPGVGPDSPAMRAVGYRQIARYVQGELSLEEAREKAVIATRRLAKRQMTWLRSWPDLQVFEPDSDNCARELRNLLKVWLESDASAQTRG